MSEIIHGTANPTQTLPIVASSNETALISMLERAARDPSIDIDKMERIWKMVEASRDREAKTSFDDALAQMHPELPVIRKNGTIEIRAKDSKGERTGPVIQSSKYPKWEDINEAITPVLAKFGFALRFAPGVADDGKVKITATLSRGGHREESWIPLPHDSTGSKNAIQAVSSSTSYGKRILATSMLNITTRGEDDDGKASEASEYITEEQVAELTKLIVDTGGDVAKFAEFAKVENLGCIYASRYEAAVEAVKRAAAQRQQAAKQEPVVDPEKQSDGEWPGPISKDQVETLRTLIINTKSDAKKFCFFMGVKNVEEIAGKDFDRAVKEFDKKRGARK